MSEAAKAPSAALRAAALHEAPPPARRKREERVVHGERIVDEYAWLRADNWQEVLRKPSALPRDIRAYLTRENEYAEAVLKPVNGLRRTLLKEMRARIKEDDSDPPTKDGPFAYYSRYRKGDEHPLICRKRLDTGRESIMLDCEKLADKEAFFDLETARAFALPQTAGVERRREGSEYYTIRVRDLERGRDLKDTTNDTDGENRLEHGFHLLSLRARGREPSLVPDLPPSPRRAPGGRRIAVRRA